MPVSAYGLLSFFSFREFDSHCAEKKSCMKTKLIFFVFHRKKKKKNQLHRILIVVCTTPLIIVCIDMNVEHSLDVFQRDFLCLFGAERQDVHLKSSQAKRCVVFELRAETLLHHVLTALHSDEQRTTINTQCALADVTFLSHVTYWKEQFSQERKSAEDLFTLRSSKL